MLKNRVTLDRRRLEDAHMIWAVLTVMEWYPENFGPEAMMLRPAHFNDSLSQITLRFHKSFSEKYAGM